jgi:hypothetical protein
VFSTLHSYCFPVFSASEQHCAVPEVVEEVGESAVLKKSLRGTSQAFLEYIPLLMAEKVSIRNN